MLIEHGWRGFTLIFKIELANKLRILHLGENFYRFNRSVQIRAIHAICVSSGSPIKGRNIYDKADPK